MTVLPQKDPFPYQIQRSRDVPSTLQSLKEENSRILHEDIERGAVQYRALPEVITLNHTDICNLQCIMCPRNKRQGKHRMDRAALEYLMHELFPYARKAVLTTSDGEPLAVDFDLLVERAIEYKVKLDVVTNGVLLTPDCYQGAREALDHINVSIDSHIPEVYEHIRQGARFSRLHENLMGIKETRSREKDDVLFSLSAVVMRSNIDHLAGLVEYAAEAGADGVVFQRMRTYLNPSPQERPETGFSREEILQRLDRACEAARKKKINLYMPEFGLPGVLVRPLRAKIPQTMENKGLCWFAAQNFAVMYTGEVYFCCHPNDHCLGNIYYKDIMSIWNGATARRLRTAHLSGRGTLFCSGCMDAPHLKPQKLWLLKPMLQRTRMVATHLRNMLHRGYSKKFRFSIFDPPAPRLRRCEGHFKRRNPGLIKMPFPHPTEALAVNPGDRTLWFLMDGALYTCAKPQGSARLYVRLKPSPAPKSTCLYFLSPGTLLAGFQGKGKLYRINLYSGNPCWEEVLSLSDPRSFVRGTVARAPSGEVWAGEYGIFPGARCAYLYRSSNKGKHFQLAHHFKEAKHIHAVHVLSDSGRVIVTTGDIAGERRLYLGSKSGRTFNAVQRSWSGFVAVAESKNHVHFGTELNRCNAFVRYRKDFRGIPEFRPFPSHLDFQIRVIASVDEKRLVALCGMDANTPIPQRERGVPLLFSQDEGATWEVIHRFSGDGSDVPQGVAVLKDDPITLVTFYSARSLVLSFPPKWERRTFQREG
jgi:MoaA/NifB/PqqE/SkfB family radical SAM enzyme